MKRNWRSYIPCTRVLSTNRKYARILKRSSIAPFSKICSNYNLMDSLAGLKLSCAGCDSTMVYPLGDIYIKGTFRTWARSPGSVLITLVRTELFSLKTANRLQPRYLSFSGRTMCQRHTLNLQPKRRLKLVDICKVSKLKFSAMNKGIFF
jgi:hypothetical protein